MKNSVIAIQSFVITTTILYALLAPIFFEMDNAFVGEGKNFVDDDKIYAQLKVAKTECKSPCPSTEEICIEVCA